MSKNVFIGHGNRITYARGGEVLGGTVFRIDTGTYPARVAGKLHYAIYRIAERPDEEITREQIIEAVTPKQLEKDILVALLGEDVLNNLQRSKEEVARFNERPTFKPKSRRFEAQSKFVVAKV